MDVYNPNKIKERIKMLVLKWTRTVETESILKGNTSAMSWQRQEKRYCSGTMLAGTILREFTNLLTI